MPIHSCRSKARLSIARVMAQPISDVNQSQNAPQQVQSMHRCQKIKKRAARTCREEQALRCETLPCEHLPDDEKQSERQRDIQPVKAARPDAALVRNDSVRSAATPAAKRFRANSSV